MKCYWVAYSSGLISLTLYNRHLFDHSLIWSTLMYYGQSLSWPTTFIRSHFYLANLCSVCPHSTGSRGFVAHVFIWLDNSWMDSWTVFIYMFVFLLGFCLSRPYHVHVIYFYFSQLRIFVWPDDCKAHLSILTW